MKNISDCPRTPKDRKAHPKRQESAPQKTTTAPQKTDGYPQVQPPLDTSAQRELNLLPDAGDEPLPLPLPDHSVRMVRWGDSVRAIPHDMARSALFCVAGKTDERRRYLDFAEIIAVDGLSITMRGEELRQDDLDVWLCVTHLARDTTMGIGIQMTANALIKELGWGEGQDKVIRLLKCLERLRGNLIRIANVGQRRGFYGNLICDLAWKDGRTTEPFTLWAIKLDPRLMQFFAPGAYSLAEWRQRLDTNAMASWLHGFYGSHSVQPHPMKVETIKTLCGSRNKNLRSFRAKLKEALDLLVEIGFLARWAIDAKADMVAVERVRNEAGQLPK